MSDETNSKDYGWLFVFKSDILFCVILLQCVILGELQMETHKTVQQDHKKQGRNLREAE